MMKFRLNIKIRSQNRDYVQTHCNDRRIPFRFGIGKWCLHNNPQC